MVRLAESETEPVELVCIRFNFQLAVLYDNIAREGGIALEHPLAATFLQDGDMRTFYAVGNLGYGVGHGVFTVKRKYVFAGDACGNATQGQTCRAGILEPAVS